MDTHPPTLYKRIEPTDREVMARLLKKDADNRLEIFELNLGVNRFGRDLECDFPLDHPTVSALHCEVILTGEAVLVRDRGSTNGTFINGEPVTEGALQGGQTLRLGDVELFVETTEVKIEIPAYERPRPVPPIVLTDGSILCPRHPQSPATHRCIHCHEVLCDGCVHRLRRKGGKVLRLCALCSQPCESLTPEQQKKKPLLAFLNKTIKLPFLRRRKDR